MATFELRNSVEKNSRLLHKLICAIEGLDSDDDAALLQAILDAVNNLTLEIENNLTCSIAKACDADTCEVVICKVCSDVEGTAISTEIYDGTTWVPDSSYAGTISLDCESCRETECDPQIESFTGDSATLSEFDEYSIFVPKCCAITVTTSAGAINLPAQPQPFNYCQKFDCLLTSFSVSGDCVDEVFTILTKSK